MLASAAASAFTVGKLSYDIVDPLNRLVQIANPGETAYTNVTSSDLTSTVTYNNKTYQVIGVGAGAFAQATLSGDLTLPEGILYIDDQAFSKASGGGLVIPASMTDISSTAFYASQLKSFNVASGNKYFSHLTTTQSDQAYTFLCNKAQNVIVAAPGLVEKPGFLWFTTKVTTITIPTQITEIGDGAFLGNPSLTTVNFHKGIKRIGTDAFMESSLTSLTLLNPDCEYGDNTFCNTPITTVSLPAGMKEIPRHMFFVCTSLRSINLPEGMTAIRIMGLSNTNLSSVNLPSTMEILDSCALQGTNITSINIKNVKQINNQCFSQCTGLTTFTGNGKLEVLGSTVFTNTNMASTQLPEGLKTMIGGSYFRCAALKEAIIPSTVETIQRNPFVGCNLLKEIKVASGNEHFAELDSCLYEIKDGKPYRLVGMPYALENREMHLRPGTQVVGDQAMREARITKFVAEEGLKELHVNSFSTCTDLTTVVLPSTLDSIGQTAFQRCEAITSLTVLAKVPPVGAADASFTAAVLTNATLYVPKGSVEAYKKAAGWKNFQNIVGVDVPDHDIKGDVNGDGTVDVDDMNILINDMLNGTARDLKAEDLNGDGTVDVDDLNVIINIMLN